MGQGSSTPAPEPEKSESATQPTGEKKKPCKACCACPETRKLRDEW